MLLKEVDEAALQRGLATIRRNYEVTVSKGKMTAEQLERTMALITPTTSYDGFDQVDIVVEAVFENMDLKKSTFAELGRVTRPDCVLASNTSTLDIDEFATCERPPGAGHRPSLLQPGERDEAARNRPRPGDEHGSDRDVGRSSANGSARCRSSSATASASSPTGCSRYYMREAYLLLEEGASVPQIDKVLIDFGMPVGPFGMQDIAGIDVGARIRQYLQSIGQDPRRGSAVGHPRSAVRDGPLRAEDRRRLVQLRGRQPQRAFPIRSSTSSRPRRRAKRGITRRAIVRRRDPRADHDGARQRGRAGARRRLRAARRRHRRHLLLRLRLPAPSRRPDVLRRHRRPADGARRGCRSTARGSATTGSRRRSSSGSWPRDAGSTSSGSTDSSAVRKICER